MVVITFISFPFLLLSFHLCRGLEIDPGAQPRLDCQSTTSKHYLSPRRRAFLSAGPGHIHKTDGRCIHAYCSRNFLKTPLVDRSLYFTSLKYQGRPST